MSRNATDSVVTHRVLITGQSMVDEAMDILAKRASYRLTSSYPPTDKIVAMAKESAIDGMIAWQGQITREALTASPNLKVVVKHGVGVDNIDVTAATELGIPVCITAEANYNSVAEHALAMMFALAKCLFAHDRRLHTGVWDKYGDMTTDLSGKRLGLVGLGRIGWRLAEVVHPLGMKVIGYDPHLPEDRVAEQVHRVNSLEVLLEESDFVSVHCAKTPETVGLIGEKAFKMMKPTAVLINTARGGIVDESALARALDAGMIAGAGLDCFETEPLSPDHPLLAFQDRVIMTPHIAGDSKEALFRTGTHAATILLNYLDGKELPPGVLLNPGALNSGTAR